MMMLPPGGAERDIDRCLDFVETYVCAECGLRANEPEIFETYDGVERAFCCVKCWQIYAQRAQNE